MKTTSIIVAIGMSLILLLGVKRTGLSSQGAEQSCDYGRYGQKVTDYQIIHAPDLNTLEEKVKEQLKNGFRPTGELSHFHKDYCQVMVK